MSSEPDRDASAPSALSEPPPLRRLLEPLEDLMVWRSFDRRGFLRHQRRWAPLPQRLSGRRYLVTGANRGIGLAIAEGLAARGASLELICRERSRGTPAAEALRALGAAEVQLVAADLSEPGALPERVASLLGANAPPLDGLIHNAGLMPAKRALNSAGDELTYAVHLLSPLRLSELLAPRLEAAKGRIIFHSSGGAYTQRLRLPWLRLGARGERGYDGLLAYAQTKRAQLILADLLHARLAPAVSVFSCHPGWVATDGLAEAMPRFTAWAGDQLRSPAEGADCALWLATAPLSERLRARGGMFFDRRPVSQHPLPWTRSGARLRRQLWSHCQRSLEAYESDQVETV